VTSPTIYGGTADGADLTLESTSGTPSATSFINFGASAAAGQINRNTNAWTIGSSAAKPTTTTSEGAGRHWVVNEDPQLVVYNSKAQGANNVSLLKLGCNTAATSAATQSYVAVKANLDSASAYGASMKLVVTNGSNAEVEGVSISSAGAVTLGASTTADYHTLNASRAGSAVYIRNYHASTPEGLVLLSVSAHPDNNTQAFLLCVDDAANRCIIYSDGDVVNHDNSYGAISDIRLKQDVVDATPQLDDILALKWRKYRFKTDAIENPNCPLHLGLIAQEVIEVCPGLVTHNEKEDTYQVQYSLVALKVAKAMQEQQAIIEKLSARIEALEKSK
jgi:hypothetical protein